MISKEERKKAKKRKFQNNVWAIDLENERCKIKKKKKNLRNHKRYQDTIVHITQRKIRQTSTIYLK